MKNEELGEVGFEGILRGKGGKGGGTIQRREGKYTRPPLHIQGRGLQRCSSPLVEGVWGSLLL